MRARPRKRPCRICGKWFEPEPRVGDRQRTCGRPECQREWHRRTCADWRRRNPDYDREGRYREKLLGMGRDEPASGTSPGAPAGGLLWSVAREEIGLKTAVTIEEACIHVARHLQEELGTHRIGVKGKSPRHITSVAQEEIGRSSRPP